MHQPDVLAAMPFVEGLFNKHEPDSSASDYAIAKSATSRHVLRAAKSSYYYRNATNAGNNPTATAGLITNIKPTIYGTTTTAFAD